MSEHERTFNSPAEKIDCSNCAHQMVCGYKESFQSAKKVIDDLHINERFPWIEEIQLRCRHFMKNRVFREEVFPSTGTIVSKSLNDVSVGSWVPNQKPVFEKDPLVAREEKRRLFDG